MYQLNALALDQDERIGESVNVSAVVQIEVHLEPDYVCHRSTLFSNNLAIARNTLSGITHGNFYQFADGYYRRIPPALELTQRRTRHHLNGKVHLRNFQGAPDPYPSWCYMLHAVHGRGRISCSVRPCLTSRESKTFWSGRDSNQESIICRGPLRCLYDFREVETAPEATPTHPEVRKRLQ